MKQTTKSKRVEEKTKCKTTKLIWKIDRKQLITVCKFVGDDHLFQLRLLDNGSLIPPTTQVSFAISVESL